MNTWKHMYAAFVAAASLVLALALAACGAAAPQTAAPAADPANIVQSFYTLINTKKVAEAMRLTADDYVMNDPFGTYDRAGAAKQWQNVVDAGLTFEQTTFKNTDGRVTSCYLVRENGKEVDKGCNNVTHVRQGKIIFDGLELAENIWVVQRYYEQVNKGNIDNAATFIADDALFINPTGSYKSKAEIVAALRAQAKDGLTFDLSNFREKDGRVVYDYTVKAKGDTLDKGTDGLTKIKAGKIIFGGNNITATPELTQENTILTNPTSAAIIGFILALPFLTILSLSLLVMLGIKPNFGPFDPLFYNPDTDKPNVLLDLIALGVFLLAVAACLIARTPIVRTVQAGGSLFAHPMHLMLAVMLTIVILFFLTMSVVSTIVDQMPCFLGVPNCD